MTFSHYIFPKEKPTVAQRVPKRARRGCARRRCRRLRITLSQAALRVVSENASHLCSPFFQHWVFGTNPPRCPCLLTAGSGCGCCERKRPLLVCCSHIPVGDSLSPGDNGCLKENRTARILRVLFLEEHVHVVGHQHFSTGFWQAWAPESFKVALIKTKPATWLGGVEFHWLEKALVAPGPRAEGRESTAVC